MSSSGPHRNFAALERRRLRAADWFAAGELRQADIARWLKVSRQTVSRWYAQWHRGGPQALRAAGRAGRKPRLTTEQTRSVAKALRCGPGIHGIAADSWTLPRVAQLIERVTGVKYHPGHVWKILGAMDWEGLGAGLSEAGSTQGKRRAARKWLTIKKTLQSRERKRG